MKFLAGLGGFVFGLIFGAPFFGALILGAVAWGIVWLFTPRRGEPARPERITNT